MDEKKKNQKKKANKIDNVRLMLFIILFFIFFFCTPIAVNVYIWNYSTYPRISNTQTQSYISTYTNTQLANYISPCTM